MAVAVAGADAVYAVAYRMPDPAPALDIAQVGAQWWVGSAESEEAVRARTSPSEGSRGPLRPLGSLRPCSRFAGPAPLPQPSPPCSRSLAAGRRRMQRLSAALHYDVLEVVLYARGHAVTWTSVGGLCS